jgi:hypothetical protein
MSMETSPRLANRLAGSMAGRLLLMAVILVGLLAGGAVTRSPSHGAAPGVATQAVAVPMLHHCAPGTYQDFVNRLSAVADAHFRSVHLSAGGASSTADGTGHGAVVSCHAGPAAGVPVALMFIAVNQYRRTSAPTPVRWSPVPVVRLRRALTVFQLATLRI